MAKALQRGVRRGRREREKEEEKGREREKKREGETEKSRYRHCLRNRISRERKRVDLAEYWDVPSMTP